MCIRDSINLPSPKRNLSGGKEEADIKLARRHPTTELGRGGKDVVREFFGQISEASLRKLAEKYRLDMALFDFDIQPFLRYAKGNGISG